MTKQDALRDELAVDKRKRIVLKYMQKLIEKNPSLYYESTSEIARSLHRMIIEHKNRMPFDEQALFKNTTIRDIEVILSYR